ncbi:MAG: response regulator [Pseudobacteriovorax sp.]|nr:response regulator [Pseudobacteriovorax sp.]
MSSRRVLLMDDEHDLAESLATLLKEGGYDVKLPESIAEASQMLDRESFDIVITDIFMQERSGYEMIDLAKRQHVEQVIAISGQGVEWEAKSRGADHFLKKPIGMKKLAKVLLKPKAS